MFPSQQGIDVRSSTSRSPCPVVSSPLLMSFEQGRPWRVLKRARSKVKGMGISQYRWCQRLEGMKSGRRRCISILMKDVVEKQTLKDTETVWHPGRSMD